MPEPEGILGEIVTRKRSDVATRLDGTSLDGLRAMAAPTMRSLRAALARNGARFVMEVKRASPSAGALRDGADPVAIARAYRGAADAISVLTDTPYFGGSFADLRAVRAEFDGPLLAKDFMIDLRQVAEARIAGADAILVMLSVLNDAEAAAMVAEAKTLGMDALVEAHSEEEVRRAVALGAEMIGINNRDLKTLKVDLATTEKLASLVPADRLLVAESGIESRADVERLAPHADAFLVGSSLMKAEDPALAARALAFGRIKVCGLTDAAAVALAAGEGAAYAGLVMVAGTPRAVSQVEAQSIVEAHPRTRFVGVFRNEKVMQVATDAKLLGLHAVQLHGEEDASYIKALRTLLPGGCEIWAAGAVAERVPEPRLGADRTLFDTKVDGRSGGTGRTFDWSQLQGRPDLEKGVLAGGLNPGNAAAAARVGTYALDVGSGVEAAPGRKDAAKLRAFFDAVRVPVRSDASC
ncbi:bifunctional indole-3-glycerol-phosphate synthase TrpC/phosphoribosylanthranilate isomerase TrpF [Sphingosinicella rhizophila]|uniref:Multifunctional fusion protein n=1 Tax=Sphingosinicella rhizophila TaxID=3050082 RepID=A0ABU3Q246_9SPHN|nr:bifunctional indole-3-glycerol-phosphate synthase TrpC/phosphoribosylanthranilate isomerase TrpF [Sphingosinicella sp. GR2756]MDT9597387.1 bifunctional indole-3-glycerol-phosphate synthase TrpC/phosphoribosylanthranilate isomerase TrpF [Sphingosinicella sp. GR2756]